MRSFSSMVVLLATTSVSGFQDAKIKPDRGPTAPFENVKLFDQYVEVTGLHARSRAQARKTRLQLCCRCPNN